MQMAENIRQKKRRNKIILISIICGIGILVLAYLLISLYFRDHFYFRTEINGLKVGGKTAEQAKEKIAADVGDYLLTIYDRDGNKYHIMGRDIGSEYMPDGAPEAALQQQNMYGWLPSIFKENKIDVATPMTYDTKMLQAAVEALPCFIDENVTKPQDAALERTDQGYVIVPEVLGNQMIQEKVVAVVEQAVTAGEGKVTLTDEVYEFPKVYQDSPQLLAALENIERYAKAEVTYEIASYQEGLNSEKILDMLVVNEDFSISFDEEELELFVQQLATRYNTYADEREFKTNLGTMITIGGGDYGWVIDKEKEAALLKENILSGEKISREPVYSQRAQVPGFDDIGNTYVEIDYTRQHMWYYEEGELILDSDIVSGNISLGNGSPDGVFKIVYKQSPAVLKGEDYESDVEYFMPFAYNVGIHDASWRTQFGGEYYKTSGSHGCINVPSEVAKALYERIEVDTPVIAYYREPVELTAYNCKVANAYSYVDPEKKNAEDGEVVSETSTNVVE